MPVTLRKGRGVIRLTPAQAVRLREWRRARDPLVHYTPTVTQNACFQSPALYRLILGGNQSGKTQHAVTETAAMARGLHPYRPSFGAMKILVVAPSRSQLAGIWGKRLLVECEMPGEIGKYPLIPKWEVERVDWNQSPFGKYPGKITLKNGTEIFFAIAGDQHSWERIQGFSFDAIVRDEAVGNSRLAAELMMRLAKAQSNPDRPWSGCILWSATPTLVNDEFEEFRARCEGGIEGHELFFIHANENPAVTMEVRNRLRASMSEEEAAIRIDGTGSALGGLRIYPQIRKDLHVLSADYVPTPTDNLWVSYDPGVAHPTGILISALAKDQPRLVRCVRFFNHKRMTLDYDVECLKHFLRGRPIECLMYDPAARKAEKATGKTVILQFEEKLRAAGIKITRGTMRAYNRHEPGIALVRHYLAPSAKRGATGATTYEAPMVVFNPSQESGCRLGLQQMMSYQSHEAGKVTGEGGVVKKNDEFPDCLRYLLCARPAWVDRGSNPPLWETGQGPIAPDFDGRVKTDDELRMEERMRRSAQAARFRIPRWRRGA